MFSKTSIAKADKLRAKAAASKDAIAGMHHAIEVLQRDAADKSAEAQQLDPHCRNPFGFWGGDARCTRSRLTRDEFKRGHCDVCEANRVRREAAAEKRQAEADAKLAQDKERYGVYPCCGEPMKRTNRFGPKPMDGHHVWNCETGKQERLQEREQEREQEDVRAIRRAQRVMAKKVRSS